MALCMTESFEASTVTTYLNTKHGRMISGLGTRQGGIGTPAYSAIGSSGPHDQYLALQSVFSGTNATPFECILDPGDEDSTIIVGGFTNTPVVGGGASNTGVQAWPQIGEHRSTGSITYCSINIYVGSGSTLTVYDAAGSSVGSTTWGPGRGALWGFIEVKVFSHASAGTIEVHVDGTEVLNLTGLDTKGAGTGSINSITWNPKTSGSLIQTSGNLDDFYVCNTDGSGPCNDFLGPVTIRQVLPVSDSVADFTPSTGSSNYAMVDETGATVPNTADYNTGTATDQKDRFPISGIPDTLPSGIAGVAIYNYAEKLDTGARSLAGVCLANGTEADTADYNLLHSSQGGPEYTRHFYSREPDGTIWTIAHVNSMETGYKARP